jgi:hypothetical protein
MWKIKVILVMIQDSPPPRQRSLATACSRHRSLATACSRHRSLATACSRPPGRNKNLASFRVSPDNSQRSCGQATSITKSAAAACRGLDDGRKDGQAQDNADRNLYEQAEMSGRGRVVSWSVKNVTRA